MPDDASAERPVVFADRLAALCAKELSSARGNPERIGEMIERLAHSIGFTIAMATGGDPVAMDTLLQGAEGYLYEAATGHAKIGASLPRPKATG